MQVILNNIVKISLSALIAFSVLTLNLTGLLQCSSHSMNEDCCHVTKTVKSCCVKKMNITFAERIKGHCGCTVNQNQQTADLYHDLKNSNTYSSSRDAQYTSTIETGYHPELISRFTSEYSPPTMDLKDSYLINLSIRI
jgi:hypothetical protein